MPLFLCFLVAHITELKALESETLFSSKLELVYWTLMES